MTDKLLNLPFLTKVDALFTLGSADLCSRNHGRICTRMRVLILFMRQNMSHKIKPDHQTMHHHELGYFLVEIYEFVVDLFYLVYVLVVPYY